MGSELPALLVAVFALISLVYGSVGLGGGSAYVATMVVLGVDHTVAPVLALTLNLVVAGGGFVHFARFGFFRSRLFLPLVVTSVPAAFFASQIPISRSAFQMALAAALLVAGIRMMTSKWVWTEERVLRGQAPIWFLGLLGVTLGAIAGLTGIGGGIYLAPVLILARLASPKQTAAISAAFIVVNSVAGLAGRIAVGVHPPWGVLIPLGITVFIGGQLGALIGSKRLKPATVQTIVGVIILVVSVRILVASYAAI